MLARPLTNRQVYAGVFPIDAGEFPKLEEAIERVSVGFASFFDTLLTFAAHAQRPVRYGTLMASEAKLILPVTVQRESSAALSQGFRLGFLGTLHMDVL